MEADGGEGEDGHPAVRQPRNAAGRECLRTVLRQSEVSLLCCGQDTKGSGKRRVSDLLPDFVVQVEDYSRRKGQTVSDTERHLSVNLAYEPAVM